MPESVKSILFICNMNSIRSPMAAALMATLAPDGIIADSAGVYSGWLDPLTERVLGEVDITLEDYATKRLQDVNLDGFDLVVVMTAEAAGEVRKLLPSEKIEFWDVGNPSSESGNFDTLLAAYRDVRDEIGEKIKQRFSHQS